MKKRRSSFSEQDNDKRRQRVALIGSLVMVGILLFSTFAYYMTESQSTNSQMEYGDYEFSYKDLGNGNGVLVTDLNGQTVEFQSLPTQVGYLEVDPTAITLMKSAPQIVLAADPNITAEDAATVDYARLQLGLAIPKMVNAMTKEDERYQLPVINCTQATSQMPVVQFLMSNDTKVTTAGACISVYGQQRELLMLKDRIIFEYYDILRDGQVVE